MSIYNSQAVNPENQIVYSDVNMFLGQSKYETVYNEDAIRNSILTIIHTKKGSRPFRRNFGSSLLAYVWEPIDDVTATALKNTLKEDILQNEPRIVLENIEVLPDIERQDYYIELSGYIPRLANAPLNFNFNLDLKTL